MFTYLLESVNDTCSISTCLNTVNTVQLMSKNLHSTCESESQILYKIVLFTVQICKLKVNQNSKLKIEFVHVEYFPDTYTHPICLKYTQKLQSCILGHQEVLLDIQNVHFGPLELDMLAIMKIHGIGHFARF